MILQLVLIASLPVFTRSMERVNTLDPLRSQSVYDSRVIQLIHETPLQIDYYARPYKLIPGVCNLPSVSEDGLTYSLSMIPDTTLTASDVERSMLRLMDKANASPGSWTMRNVESINVVNSRELKIRLKKRQHVFPWMLAMSYMALSGPGGELTGPYCLTKWRKNHEMVFERNKSWRGWNAPASLSPAGVPYEKIRYLVIDDVSTQWLMFLRGELDFLGEISRDNWDAVIAGDGELSDDLVKRGIRLYSSNMMDIRYMGMNMRDKTLGGNKKLRQALCAAFDSKAWCKFFNNRVSPADGAVPPGIDGRLETPYAYSYNIEKARKLLAEAGYVDGIDKEIKRRLTIKMAIGRASQDSREAGELMASFYEKIGIKLELQFHTWEAFLKAVNEGRVQLYMMGWVGDYPDAENFLQLFHSANSSPGPNHSCYENAEFDREYDAAMNCTSREERNRHWLRCQEIVREDAPWIFAHYTKSYSLSHSEVHNYVPGDFPYGQEKHLRYLK